MWRFKKVVETNPEVKPDKQARVFVVELADGTTEAVVVFDLGSTQSCIHLRGPEMRMFMHDCADFYDGCEYLRWEELRKTLATCGLPS